MKMNTSYTNISYLERAEGQAARCNCLGPHWRWIVIWHFLILFTSCVSTEEQTLATASPETKITLDHFNFLYQEIEVEQQPMGIVHIYSEYPDYHYAIEPREGFTCVDDVARAVIMLSEYYQAKQAPPAILEQIKMLLQFVLYMQNENGYFNNFMWGDHSINTTYQTTVAELNWWSLRALWALETAFPLVQKDTELTNRMEAAVDRLITNIMRDLPIDDLQTEEKKGMTIPTWLPQKYAADQAAVLLLGLIAHHQRTTNDLMIPVIRAMADGISLMQRGSPDAYPYLAFMSWDNLWHAWGNSQAYALLKTGQYLNEEKYITAALREVDHFYPYLLEQGFAEAFWISKENGVIRETKRNSFPQIAYGIRPMVWASWEAWEITREDKYAVQARALEAWLHGENIAETTMYDPVSGRCYDGIISADEVNRNSGAESTIEALLTLIRTRQKLTVAVNAN